MNLQDRITEIVLSALDAVLDIFTLGAWTRARGAVVPNIKVKGGE